MEKCSVLSRTKLVVQVCLFWGDTVNKEAAWRRLNPQLHCGQNKMKLKVTGPRAADLQLDTGIVTHPTLEQNLKAVKCLASISHPP